MVERERFLVPEPQVAEHAPKADQPEALQSIGHWKWLQDDTDMSIPHATPPY